MKFTEEEMSEILEVARLGLEREFYYIAEAMDLSDDYLSALRRKIDLATSGVESKFDYYQVKFAFRHGNQSYDSTWLMQRPSGDDIDVTASKFLEDYRGDSFYWEDSECYYDDGQVRGVVSSVTPLTVEEFLVMRKHETTAMANDSLFD